MRYFTEIETYYVYSETLFYYREVSPRTLRLQLQQWLNTTILWRRGNNVQFARRLEEELRGLVPLVRGLPKPDFRYIGLTNGVLEKSTKKLIGNSRDIFLTGTTTYAYDASATCSKFLQFMDQFSGGDKLLVKLIQSYM